MIEPYRDNHDIPLQEDFVSFRSCRPIGTFSNNLKEITAAESLRGIDLRLFILVIEYYCSNRSSLFFIYIWTLWLTFALTLCALALVNCFSLAAGMRMSQSVSRMLPSSGFALGKPMIVPCCCVKKTNHCVFSVYVRLWISSLLLTFKEKNGRSNSTKDNT